MLLENIADKGNDLETLKALRQKLAKTIDESKSGRDIATLSRQLQIVMAQISEYEELHKYDQGETALDIVRKKHAKKRLSAEPDMNQDETALDIVRKRAKERKARSNED